MQWNLRNSYLQQNQNYLNTEYVTKRKIRFQINKWLILVFLLFSSAFSQSAFASEKNWEYYQKKGLSRHAYDMIVSCNEKGDTKRCHLATAHFRPPIGNDLEEENEFHRKTCITAGKNPTGWEYRYAFRSCKKVGMAIGGNLLSGSKQLDDEKEKKRLEKIDFTEKDKNCNSIISSAEDAFKKGDKWGDYDPLPTNLNAKKGTPGYVDIKNIGQHSKDLCKKTMRGDLKAKKKYIELHRYVVENLYTHDPRRWGLLANMLNITIGENYKNDTIGLMSYYLSKYNETKNIYFAVASKNLGWRSDFLLSSSEIDYLPFPKDEALQYGELVAVISALHVAESDNQFIFVKLGAERLTQSNNVEIRSVAQKIVNYAEKKYAKPNHLPAIIMGLLAIAVLLPSESTSSNPPPQGHVYKPPSFNLDEALLWVE